MPMKEERLDFAKLGQITFEDPDTDTFKGLALAFESARIGGSMPTVFNAANEMAVKMFLNNKIRFLEIYDMIQGAMDNHKKIENPNVEEILMAEKETYDFLSR